MLALACALAPRSPSTGLNDADKLFFESWIQVNHPDAVPSTWVPISLGDKPGTGRRPAPPTPTSFVRVLARHP